MNKALLDLEGKEELIIQKTDIKKVLLKSEFKSKKFEFEIKNEIENEEKVLMRRRELFNSFLKNKADYVVN